MNKYFIVVISFFLMVGISAAEPPSLKPLYHVSPHEPFMKQAQMLERHVTKATEVFDFYVGGTYNKQKGTGYPIVALKYNKYTLEFADEDWFDAPSNHYWKFKMKKFLGFDKLYLELSQKKKEYTVKGFVQLF